ncbi:MAG: PAS domain-containing protein [Proteobacteria bacterium]|nr:PAS domain-containing protein [Pseudomonadota bacterium]
MGESENAMRFDKQIALRCFEESPPSIDAKPVVDYWLSLWQGDTLPARADFEPKGVAKVLPSIAIFDVVPDQSVHCRLMGSSLTQGLGHDPKGEDWIALTRPEDRCGRLQRWSNVARGAIGRGLRTGYRESGAKQLVEEILLPFAAAEDGDRHQVIYHISWKQTVYDPTRGGVSAVNCLAQPFRLIDLRM